MSIFGDLDVDNIPDDPFFTAQGTYWCIVTDAKIKEKDGNHQLIIDWNIDEPDSEYHGNKLTQFFSLFPGRRWEDLSSDEKKPYKFFKKQCRRGFDLNEEETANVNVSDLIGKQAFVTVVQNEGKGEHEGRTFTNIRDVVSKRVHEEEKGSDATSSSLGL